MANAQKMRCFGINKEAGSATVRSVLREFCQIAGKVVQILYFHCGLIALCYLLLVFNVSGWAEKLLYDDCRWIYVLRFFG